MPVKLNAYQHRQGRNDEAADLVTFSGKLHY